MVLLIKVVLESFNLAAFLSLRIVFICENNQYAQSTKLLDVSKASVAEKARGFGINSFEIDGLNISNVKDVSFKIINDVREKGFCINSSQYL